ncbi:hypothetical protein VTJ04DRAFT_10753 [Mycothermus thermophilus]|uniref:uncharacterized protein n=1 Tax=Humicola insolens TaxID=85995 RepID=UPI003743FA1A
MHSATESTARGSGLNRAVCDSPGTAGCPERPLTYLPGPLVGRNRGRQWTSEPSQRNTTQSRAQSEGDDTLK